MVNKLQQTFHWWQLEDKTHSSLTQRRLRGQQNELGGHEKLKERQIRNWCQAPHFNCGTECQTLTQSRGHPENDQRALGGHWALGCSNFLQKTLLVFTHCCCSCVIWNSQHEPGCSFKTKGKKNEQERKESQWGCQSKAKENYSHSK